MPRRIYRGPIDAVIVTLSGNELRVERGDVVDVSEEDAKRLDAVPENWDIPKGLRNPPGPDKQKEGD